MPGQTTPTYSVTSIDGPPHERMFSVRVTVSVDADAGDPLVGMGQGPSKKVAEQRAAEHALLVLNETG